MSDLHDLYQQVRAVLDETDLTDPHEIAAKVADQLPAKELRQAVRELLAAYVRTQFARLTPRGYDPTSTYSAKRAAIAAAAPDWLRRRVCVAPGRFALLGECGYDALHYAEQTRRDHAARVEAAADWFHELAEAVKSHKVPRVDALPPAVLAHFGNGSPEDAA